MSKDINSNKNSEELDNKSVPRNMSQWITDDEVDAVLKSAERQLEKPAKQPENQVKENKADQQDRPAKENQQEKTEKQDKKDKQEKTDNQDKKNNQDKKVEVESKPAMDMEEPFVQKSPQPAKVDNPYRERWTFGRIIGTFLECVWTIFKIAVVVTIVTVISGVLLSGGMMIRGRNGVRRSMEQVAVSSEVLATASSEKEKVKEWLSSVKREKLSLETDDESILIARKIVANPEDNRWVVILHGYNGCMEDVYDVAMHYNREGYNVLLPDLRAHGESEGSFIGMGWLDRLDVINWIDVILSENSNAQIVIHGIDMGADTALMLTGEPLKSGIKGVIAEGAYTSAWAVMKKEFKARHEKLPVFPFMHMMNPVMKVWAGYSLKEADAVKQVKNAHIPILLIRGEEDTYITPDMTETLNEAIASSHEVAVIPGATHEACRYADLDTYYGKALQFTASVMK